MAIYEDDPRVGWEKPKYGGSTNRSSAKRGEPRLQTGATEPKQKKDPRLPAAPKAEPTDRAHWKDLKWKEVPKSEINRLLTTAAPAKDAVVHDLLKLASPLASWFEERRRQEKPTTKDWLRVWDQSQRVGRNPGTDQGIVANPKPGKEQQSVQIPRPSRWSLPEWSGRT